MVKMNMFVIETSRFFHGMLQLEGAKVSRRSKEEIEFGAVLQSSSKRKFVAANLRHSWFSPNSKFIDWVITRYFSIYKSFWITWVQWKWNWNLSNSPYSTHPVMFLATLAKGNLGHTRPKITFKDHEISC